MNAAYRLILVDDEDEVRGRIATRIANMASFEIVGTAGNGYDAIDLIETHAPHVVLTDIRMPYIDGIELASIIRRDYPTVKVGFITGYNDFDYAREAIDLQVRTYLMKPLTEQAIAETLEKLRKELDAEYEDLSTRRFIERQYEESVPLLVEQTLSSLLLESGPPSAERLAELERLGVGLSDLAYRLAYTVVERGPELWDVVEFEKTRQAVRLRMENMLNASGIRFFSLFFHDGLIFILAEPEHDASRTLDLTLNQMIQTVERFVGVRIDIGVGNVQTQPRGLRKAYDEARQAADAGRLQDVQRLIYFSDITTDRRQIAHLTSPDRERIEQLLRYDTPQRLREELSQIAERCNHRLLMLETSALLARYASHVGADPLVGSGGDLLETVARLQSIDEFIDWAERFFARLRTTAQESQMDQGERSLERVVSYMRDNYADRNLTMQDVCAHQGISISYLGQLFRRYRNTTFVKFLTSLRMERAKEHLELNSSRIVDVADLCGYRDVYYFSHCFRKYTGESPRQYRDARR